MSSGWSRTLLCSRALFFIGFHLAVCQAAVSPIQGTDLNTGKAVHWQPGERPSVVVFLSPLCPCSRSHEPVLESLSKRYPDVQFIGVVSNASEWKQAPDHFRKSGLSFSVVAELEHRLADIFEASNTPHAFVFDKSGRMVFHGGVDDSHQTENAKRHYLAQVLFDLQNGKQVGLRMERALGCPIRR